MFQTQALTLPEALVFMEETVKNTAQSPLPPEVQLALSKVLERAGDDIPVPGVEREVAVLFAMVTSMCFFESCNGAIVTDSVPHAELFFQSPLFNGKGPAASDLAPRFGKRLVSAWNPIRIANLEEIDRLQHHLNDPSAIPVFDFLSLEEANSIVAESTAEHAHTGWLKKLVTAREPEAIQKLRSGMGKLNCVIKVVDGIVSADTEVGVEPILGWAAKHQIETVAQ